MLAVFLATGCVPSKYGPMIRRRENPRQFWFAIGLYGVILFGFTYAAIYVSIPWPKH